MANETSADIHITNELAIPLSELAFRFSRSGGPGGQNVNRRETRVELCFDIKASPSLNDAQRGTLIKQLTNQVDRDGILHVVADTHRSQLHNRQDAIERFTRLIRQGLRKPKRRRPTKPSPQCAEQRLSGKRRRGETKRLRKPVQSNDS